MQEEELRSKFDALTIEIGNNDKFHEIALAQAPVNKDTQSNKKKTKSTDSRASDVQKTAEQLDLMENLLSEDMTAAQLAYAIGEEKIEQQGKTRNMNQMEHDKLQASR